MAKNEQQRQKKLAKKRSKELVKKKQAAREKNEMLSLSGQIAAARLGAIHSCRMNVSLLVIGDALSSLGSLVIARVMPDRRLMMVRYLVDGACLGVKDVQGEVLFPAHFSELIAKNSRVEELTEVPPETALKYLLGCVEFARESGFYPAANYEQVHPIWEGVDPDRCAESFSYGQDGKPLYYSGPHESRQDQMRILETLTQSRGEGNFDFMLGSEIPGSLGADGEFYLDDYDDELDIGIDEDAPVHIEHTRS